MEHYTPRESYSCACNTSIETKENRTNVYSSRHHESTTVLAQRLEHRQFRHGGGGYTRSYSTVVDERSDDVSEAQSCER
jgi:hypothetical protein